MKPFDPIDIEWAGKKYTIPSTRLFGAIRRLEDVLTLPELTMMMTDPLKMKYGLIAEAYTLLIKYAGGDEVRLLKELEVYEWIFLEGKTAQEQVMGIISRMMSLLIPPAALDNAQVRFDQARKEANAGNESGGEVNSSPPSSDLPSESGSSSPPSNSGDSTQPSSGGS